MVEPDVAIAKVGEPLDRSCKDAKLCEALRQESSEAALRFLHPRDVSVAEHRDAIRVHRYYFVDGIAKALGGLMWQPVDQIDVDAFEAYLAAVVVQAQCVFEGLHSMNGLLHERIEVLNAHADAIEA